MKWGERASDRYPVELIEKKPSAGRWFMAIMDVVTGSTPSTDMEFEFHIVDLETKAIVYQENFGAVAGDEAMEIGRKDLEEMSVSAFREKYLIETPPDG